MYNSFFRKFVSQFDFVMNSLKVYNSFSPLVCLTDLFLFNYICHQAKVRVPSVHFLLFSLNIFIYYMQQLCTLTINANWYEVLCQNSVAVSLNGVDGNEQLTRDDRSQFLFIISFDTRESNSTPKTQYLIIYKHHF